VTLPIHWTNRALHSLDLIAHHIALDNPAAAERVVIRLLSIVDHVTEHPEMGRAGRVEGTRELVAPGLPSIVAYRVLPTRVQILTAMHASQQWPQRL
jgi:toxin ParE1/3/4